MLKLFQEYIARHQLCKTTDKILLAVSGGIDSMVMLHLFHASGYTLGVAHCNFRLRGEESDADESFVKQMCNGLHIPFFSTHFNTNNYAAEEGISIQMAARELRYTWFQEIRVREKFDCVATAHHLNDSVETVLLNLIHGRGISGLTGISVKNNTTIRPMLFALRGDIEKYAMAGSIRWREDASNQTNDYARNSIRHDIIPVLRGLNANLERTVERGIEKNLGAQELLRMGVAVFESMHMNRSSDRITIHKDACTSLQHPAAVLYELIREFGFSLEQSDAIVKSLPGQVGKSFFTSTHVLVVDRADLLITKNSLPVTEIHIQEGQQEVTTGPWRLELIETNIVSKLNQHDSVSLDADRITYPLIWRSWRKGDYFYPLGMDHKKKVSDFLIDRKVPRNDKGTITVVESAGEIFWVVGHQISNRFKITSDTRRTLRLTIKPYFI